MSASAGGSARELAIMSGVRRQGSWQVPKNLRVLAVMGGIDLDFCEAVFGPGVSEVNVISVMGGVAVIVPPHLQVECNGVGILGNFEGLNQAMAEHDPNAPLLRITGTAVMGALKSQAGRPKRP